MGAFDELERCIDDPSRVSPQQREVLRSRGDFFLHARPGSGKTRTVAIRAARLALMSSGHRVALTSYTHVAIEQITTTMREWGVILGPEHFVGTIHEFLLRFVLYPFGHLAPVQLRRPFRLIADAEWSGWPSVIYRNDQRKRLSVAALHYKADGGFKAITSSYKLGLSKEQAATEEVNQAKRLKKEARERGLVSLSDAMFYAQKLLEEYPSICAHIAARFHELIVDEVQDTSDSQMRCIEHLKASGMLHSVVLVGDLDQSIYGFQGACPGQCRQLAEACQLTEVPLTDNFRSSQAICDVTCKFCQRLEADRAAGPHATVQLMPELLRYDAGKVETAVEVFQSRLNALALPSESAVVLVRGNRFRDRLNGRESDESVGRAVLALSRFVGTFRATGEVSGHELHVVERLLADMAWGESPDNADAADALRLRNAAISLLRTLPAFAGTVAEWIEAARAAVALALAALTDTPCRKPGHLMKKARGHESRDAGAAFEVRPAALWARTVHDVKGESHGAVVLVVEPRNRDRDQAEIWAAPLLGQAVTEEDAEETRIAYVALTRAERYCAIAFPDNVAPSALAPYLAAGFNEPNVLRLSSTRPLQERADH